VNFIDDLDINLDDILGKNDDDLSSINKDTDDNFDFLSNSDSDTKSVKKDGDHYKSVLESA